MYYKKTYTVYQTRPYEFTPEGESTMKPIEGYEKNNELSESEYSNKLKDLLSKVDSKNWFSLQAFEHYVPANKNTTERLYYKMVKPYKKDLYPMQGFRVDIPIDKKYDYWMSEEEFKKLLPAIKKTVDPEWYTLDCEIKFCRK